MPEHFGSSTVMSQCVPLALNSSVKNGRQCTLMKSSNLFCLCMLMTSKPKEPLAQGWSMLRTRLKN